MELCPAFVVQRTSGGERKWQKAGHDASCPYSCYCLAVVTAFTVVTIPLPRVHVILFLQAQGLKRVSVKVTTVKN